VSPRSEEGYGVVCVDSEEQLSKDQIGVFGIINSKDKVSRPHGEWFDNIIDWFRASTAYKR